MEVAMTITVLDPCTGNRVTLTIPSPTTHRRAG
jgi:hypothetical protein